MKMFFLKKITKKEEKFMKNAKEKLDRLLKEEVDNKLRQGRVNELLDFVFKS